MCLEDLRLGRGRFVGQRIFRSATLQSVLPPNNRRVALAYSYSAIQTFDSAGASVLSDQIRIVPGDDVNGIAVVFAVGTSGEGVLRIEDLGSLITGAWSVVIGNASGNGTVTLTEILSNVTADPITK